MHLLLISFSSTFLYHLLFLRALDLARNLSFSSVNGAYAKDLSGFQRRFKPEAKIRGLFKIVRTTWTVEGHKITDSPCNSSLETIEKQPSNNYKRMFMQIRNANTLHFNTPAKARAVNFFLTLWLKML